MEYWGTVPPPNISLAFIAKAHGAKFDRHATIGPSQGFEETAVDPERLVAELGLGGIGKYVPPQKGLPITPKPQESA